MISFIETKLFTRLVQVCPTTNPQQALLSDPEAGAIIPGSGGVRKLRWGVSGRGKRGGIRVICFLRTRHGQIWMLSLYSKNVADSISAKVLKQIKDAIDG